MNGFLENIPEWIKIIFGIGGGAGAGAQIHKWYRAKLDADNQEFEQESKRRDELRTDLDNLRKRQEKYELELVETRNSYFEMQEKYHSLKLDYAEANKENKMLREEVKELRKEIIKLREKLEEN